MTDDFSMLFELVGQSPPEVFGHGAIKVPEDLRAQLVRLAGGKCNQEDRRKLILILEKQPELISTLADLIKELRDRPNNENSPS
jgi:hypothetical protein